MTSSKTIWCLATTRVVVFDADGCVYEFCFGSSGAFVAESLQFRHLSWRDGKIEVSSEDDPLNVWTYVWDNGLGNGPCNKWQSQRLHRIRGLRF